MDTKRWLDLFGILMLASLFGVGCSPQIEKPRRDKSETAKAVETPKTAEASAQQLAGHTFPTGHTAKGTVDDVVHGVVHGWFASSGFPGGGAPVHVYFNAPAGGGGTFGVACDATIDRPDVVAAEGTPLKVGFACPLPDDVKLGLANLFVYGIATKEPPQSMLLTNAPILSLGAPPRPHLLPGPPSNQIPSWQSVHATSKAAAQSSLPLVFIGDSSMSAAHTPGYGLAAWNKYVKGERTHNFGLGGDTTTGLLWRMIDGMFPLALNPRIVVISIGGNNIPSPQYSPEDIFLGVKMIVRLVRVRAPNAKVVVFSIFPRGGDAEPTSAGYRQKIFATNQLLATLKEGEIVHFMDFWANFMNPSGAIRAELYAVEPGGPMNLHANAAGYEIILSRLYDLMKNLAPDVFAGDGAAAAPPPSNRVHVVAQPAYRLYNSKNQDHMMSLAANEGANAFYNPESIMFYAATHDFPGAMPFFRCNIGADIFESMDGNCEGRGGARRLGWLSAHPRAGTVPIYRCARAAGAEDRMLVLDGTACAGIGYRFEGAFGYGFVAPAVDFDL